MIPALLDLVTFGNVMAAAQNLNVLRVFRRSALRVWNDVIEMKAGVCRALYAAALITLPDL